MFNFGPSPNILQKYLQPQTADANNPRGQMPTMDASNPRGNMVAPNMMMPTPSFDASTMDMNNPRANPMINAGPSPAMMSSMGMAPGQSMSSQPNYNPMSGIAPTGPPRQGNGGPLTPRALYSFNQMRNMNPQTAHNMNNLTRVQKG